MTEHKFTDDEIIRALECCKNEDCDNCPFFKYPKSICRWDVWDCALDLINRQKAEIEEYQKHIDNDIIYVKRVKAEAIKEFAERLKERGYTNNYCQDIVLVESIDNLVKEMTEGES